MLANDILIIAIAPLLIVGARARGFDPRPFAIALAAATNAGSAATLIGNPQNILVGEIGRLDFWTFPRDLRRAGAVQPGPRLRRGLAAMAPPHHRRRPPDPAEMPRGRLAPVRPQPGDQGRGRALALLLLFLTPLPREIGALLIAAVLLANRKITSRTMIAAVDWPLLLLVACLFAITGDAEPGRNRLAAAGISCVARSAAQRPRAVDPVQRLHQQRDRQPAGDDAAAADLADPAARAVLYALALLSTLAGNMLLSGSLTNVLIGQHYSGDVAFSNFTQIFFCIANFFLSAAVGLCALAAIIRALRGDEHLGNFFVDMWRVVTYMFLPAAFVISMVFLTQGMPMTYQSDYQVITLEPAAMGTDSNNQPKQQTIVIGPLAAFVPMKMMGTNGGGFFGMNSAHPFENPSAGTNFFDDLLHDAVSDGAGPDVRADAQAVAPRHSHLLGDAVVIHRYGGLGDLF